MNRRTTGQPQKRQYKQKNLQGRPRPSPPGQTPSPKMASGNTRGGTEAQQCSNIQVPEPSPRAVIRDPFSSQSSGEQDDDPQVDALSLPSSPKTPLDLPGSPGSSMDRNMAEIADSLFSQPQSNTSQGQLSLHSAPYPGDATILSRFSTMLQQELSKACTIITSDIKQDIQSFGLRLDTIETKVDGATARVNQNTRIISDLQDRLEEANAKIEDLENRSRRYNVRVRGLPEKHTDLEEAIQTLMKDLIPDISPHHLEVDRVHRALQAPRLDGLPRDIIMKPHYYKIKEKLMVAARNRQDLSLLGTSIQLFADLAPSTVQKRRTLKPLLQQLMNRQIKYRWSFPFRLSFTFQGKSHSFVNYHEGEDLLLELGIISRDRQTASSSNSTDRPLSPIWSSQRPRRNRQTPPHT